MLLRQVIDPPGIDEFATEFLGSRIFGPRLGTVAKYVSTKLVDEQNRRELTTRR
mgnify:CR=1 FL=1